MTVYFLDNAEELSSFGSKLFGDVPTSFRKPKFHGSKKQGSVENIRCLNLLFIYIRTEVITVLPRPYGDPAEIAVLS